ncbi:DUF4148 domain-containing protein [Hydrogenophaga sp. IBVHS2]|uniref:DUF4148 domain-containing protein n=1 Tax=Hydrogenophaga sp. IBVHS2 TaxID=1985170 RepID=UPI000A2E4D16|nr:DUF4148 domain-containing protein [Hydrogenophaga sp. IBVHS2]OSZ64857.1 hypothetical protein CAP38_10725 [Hydrogenophaga sp. IBVHS2]
MFNRTLILSAIATFAALPMAASATSLYHPADGEAGVTKHLDHLTSTKTRAQVQAEVLAAQKDGSLFRIQRSLPLPAETQGMNKTRAQVVAEVLNEPAAERRAREALLAGG